MIFEFFGSKSNLVPYKLSQQIRFSSSRFHLLTSCIALAASLSSLNCNQPFQPSTEYKPKLVLYSILLGNQTGVYVKLTSTVTSANGKIGEPVHGADVRLVAVSTSQFIQTRLADSTSLIQGDTVSFYYANVHVVAGEQYMITAAKGGYDSVSAEVSVPNSYVTIPSKEVYNVMKVPDSAKTNISVLVNLSDATAAYFTQFLLEYRGFDKNGNFQMGFERVTPYDSTDPFVQRLTNQVTFTVDTATYRRAFKATEKEASALMVSHLYTDIIVIQIDDPLYRFYITSGRTANPLAMRIDKIIFSNLYNGVGIVGAAAVDTTRIFLF